MSGIPIKNHGKKPQGFLEETETNSCETTRKYTGYDGGCREGTPLWVRRLYLQVCE